MLIEKGIMHKGFSFIHALSPCPTFYNTFDAWDFSVTPIAPEHDPHDRMQGLALAMEPISNIWVSSTSKSGPRWTKQPVN